MNKVCVFLLSWAGIASAGTLSLSATGVSSAPAEFARVQITVSSRCYDKAVDAKKANNELANAFATKLKVYATKEAEDKLGQKIFAQEGGAVDRRDEQSGYDEQTRKPIYLCKQKWATNQVLTLNLTALDKLPDVLDEVLAGVDQNSLKESEGAAQTWATFQSPGPGVSKATAKKLQAEALKNAIAKAKEEALLIQAECTQIVNLKLAEVLEPGISTARSERSVSRSAALESAPGGASDVNTGSEYSFNDITASVTRVFVFEFDGGALSCPTTK